MTHLHKIRNYLSLGLLGALITVVAEMLQGFASASDTADRMTKLFSSLEQVPTWRVGLGSTLGALGILLQFAGVYALWLSLSDKALPVACTYRAGMYVFSVLGAIVHVLMSMMIHVYQTQDIAALTSFTIWFILPIVALFFIGYIPFSIAMAVAFFRRRSILPAWLGWFNPLLGKVFFSIITSLLPNCALVNGISFSNMGLSSVILFSLALFCANRQLQRESIH